MRCSDVLTHEMKRALEIVVIAITFYPLARAGYSPCPNLCSGHGNCPLTRVCECVQSHVETLRDYTA